MKVAMMLGLCAGVGTLVAQTDIAGSKDHPLVTRYAGSTIIGYLEKNYESLEAPTGPVVTTREGKYAWKSAERAEGAYTRIRYRGPAGRNALEVFRNFQAPLLKAGFKPLYACDLAACDNLSYFKFTSVDGVLSGNRAQEHFMSAKLTGGGKSVYVLLYVTENQNSAPEAQPAEIRVDKGLAVVQLEILETAAMDTGMVTVDAQAMKKAIQETGRVALYGIYFDTGAAVIKPESKAALDEIARLLKTETGLRVLVVGHTDTVGAWASNQDLSLKRAQAVVAALTTQYGIAGARLQAAGVGFAAPVASNRSEAGRAKNRRVELVEF